MDTLLSIVKHPLTAHDFRPEKRDNGLAAVIDGYNGLWRLHVVCNEDDRWVVFRSMLPVAVPKALRKRAATLIAWLNYGLIAGSFELDMTDGEVAYKTSIRLSEDELTDAMVADLLRANFSTFDRALPAFMALVHAKCSVRHALTVIGHDMGDAREAASVPDAAEPSGEAPQ